MAPNRSQSNQTKGAAASSNATKASDRKAASTPSQDEAPKSTLTRKKVRISASHAAVSDTTATHTGPYTLCIDIGGTGTKAIVLDQTGNPVSERLRELTPRPATPQALLGVLSRMLPLCPAFDRVSVGFPGVVHDNVTHTAPNLDTTWAQFPLGRELEKLSGKPTRVLNDAGVQGYGVVEGKGVEMVITFGTGMGTALFLDGRYVPNLELAHHPLKGGKTYEELISDAVLKDIGKRHWNKRIRFIIDTVLPIWNPRVLYLGGGNARLIKGSLPEHVRVVDNIAGLLGGIALWNHEGQGWPSSQGDSK